MSKVNIDDYKVMVVATYRTSEGRTEDMLDAMSSVRALREISRAVRGFSVPVEGCDEPLKPRVVAFNSRCGELRTSGSWFWFVDDSSSDDYMTQDFSIEVFDRLEERRLVAPLTLYSEVSAKLSLLPLLDVVSFGVRDDATKTVWLFLSDSDCGLDEVSSYDLFPNEDALIDWADELGEDTIVEKAKVGKRPLLFGLLLRHVLDKALEHTTLTREEYDRVESALTDVLAEEAPEALPTFLEGMDDE